jgi:hypothetical protein
MAQNPTISQLDSGQIVKRVYDEANDAIRVEMGAVNGIAISLSADDGDSVLTVPDSISTSATITNANTGTIIAATACVGIKSFILYTNTVSTLVGPQLCSLELSPSDTDNVWIPAMLSITPDTTQDVMVMSPVNPSIVARRCRVTIASAITSGSFKIYLLGQAV